jgi:hypothetical protein
MATAMTDQFAAWHDCHRGATILVCGCGSSLALLEGPERFITIGVNDVGRRFTPDYLVVVNAPRQFDNGRYHYVLNSQAKAVFSHLDVQHPRAVRFRLGRRGGTIRADPGSLHHTANSPYVAVNLARHMGAARIGLIGVDFTDHHFFGPTGTHPLTARLDQIDSEYAALFDACRADGVELVNLSPHSRLTAMPRARLQDWAPARVFCVHYRFLSCGTVFDSGLREAAATLGLASAHADWDDPHLLAKVQAFQPDVLLVVHGRRFVQRWGDAFNAWRRAVWLLDEPYEVDDTAGWSGKFDHVFVDDAATLARHRHAHFLPVAYAPALHHAGAGARRYRVGFIGGANPARERLLGGLAARGLLDYVVGGPWTDPRLAGLCLAANIPAEQTAALYRDTTIIINVFRDKHHYNRAGLIATAMNPRICEALACGALVLSEPRADLLRDVPELPLFDNVDAAAVLIDHFLADPAASVRVQLACAARLADATYAQRLKTVMEIALHTAAPIVISQPQAVPFDADWIDLDSVVRAGANEEIVLDPGPHRAPGGERGLASRLPFEAVELSFEAWLAPGACLLAKVHQVSQRDQCSNSYHLLLDERRAYLARHQHVFRQVERPRPGWVAWRLACAGGVLSLWCNGQLLHRVRDQTLRAGFAFLGAQGGPVRVRALTLTVPGAGKVQHADDADELRPAPAATPRLTIVTTVYDRIECLRQCIASVQRLAFRDYEHLIVADHPPGDALARIEHLVDRAADTRIGLFNLKQRHNDWGIAPAAAGLRRARGEYLCFLSDDNGYTPDHADILMRVLDREPMIGFAYSSCQYDGRMVLNYPVPRPGRIDLGQPMFRRELFELYLGDGLPFDMMAWDWHLVDTLMRRGVRWRHVDRQSFIFRLAQYPRLLVA